LNGRKVNGGKEVKAKAEMFLCDRVKILKVDLQDYELA
jgi:hypothetical protein